jgi:NADPH:quinone reductase-like Zn-dependent oxidoreductase
LIIKCDQVQILNNKKGLTKLILPYSFPFILGHDFSGVVEEIGESVTKFKVGDEVFGRAPDGRIGISKYKKRNIFGVYLCYRRLYCF